MNNRTAAREKMRREGRLMSYDELLNKLYGEDGTSERKQFDEGLRMEILAEEIRQLRKERRLTQMQLGEMVGVGKGQISKLENNPAKVSLQLIIDVLKALSATFEFRIEPLSVNRI